MTRKDRRNRLIGTGARFAIPVIKMARIHDDEPDDYPFRDVLERFDDVKRESESIRAQLNQQRRAAYWPERHRSPRPFDEMMPPASNTKPSEQNGAEQ
jgi:hypothetical protein